jgi:hypothetical protein
VLSRGPQGSTLYVRGRDIEEAEHAVAFNGDTCRWTILGEATEVKRSETRKKIMAYLLNAKDPMGPKDIDQGSTCRRHALFCYRDCCSHPAGR